MLNITINSNSIYIPIVLSGCTSKLKIDSTYPIYLNGIINQDEFEESIKQINYKLSNNIVLTILHFIFIFSIIIGIVLLLVTSLSATSFMDIQLTILHIFGIILMFFGFLFSGLIYVFKILQREQRMKKIITNESKKYSSRLPISCDWRFEVVEHELIRYNNEHNISPGYYLVIDIGYSTSLSNDMFYSNEVDNQSIGTFNGKENNAPPPYSILPIQFNP